MNRLISLIALALSCQMVMSQKVLEVTVKNPISVQRQSQPVVIPLQQYGMEVCSALVTLPVACTIRTGWTYSILNAELCGAVAGCSFDAQAQSTRALRKTTSLFMVQGVYIPLQSYG